MIKKDAKGLTLLELLVAMSIFTIVIFIGYKVMDQSAKSVKDQGNINKGQLTMNDMNEYLTKDLEQATSIKLLLDGVEIADTKPVKDEKNDELQSKVIDLIEPKLNDKNIELFKYEYIVRDNSNSESNEDYVKYLTEVKKEGGNTKYSVSRIDKDGVKIDFMSSQVLTENKLPFLIVGNNSYEVTMKYNGKNNKMISHVFNVTSRYLLAGDEINGDNDETPMIPIIPIPKPPNPEEITPSGSTAIGFWTADESKCVKNNLYTWIKYNNEFDDDYGTQGTEKNVFDINANLSSNDKPSANDNSGKIFSHIDNKYNWSASAEATGIKANSIKSIMVYVQGFTTLDTFKDYGHLIQNLTIYQGPGRITGNSTNGWKLYGGNTENSGTWFEATLSTNNKEQNFNINGKLSIDKSKVSSGYALIVYDKSDDIDVPEVPTEEGDIVFEFTRNKNIVNMKMEVTVGETPQKSDEKRSENSTHNVTALIKTDDQNGIHITGMGDISSKDPNFRNVKGAEIKLIGNIRVTGFNVDHIFSNESLSSNLSKEIYFPRPAQYGLRFNNVHFDKLLDNQTGKIVINLIY